MPTKNKRIDTFISSVNAKIVLLNTKRKELVWEGREGLFAVGGRMSSVVLSAEKKQSRRSSRMYREGLRSKYLDKSGRVKSIGDLRVHLHSGPTFRPVTSLDIGPIDGRGIARGIFQPVSICRESWV